MTLRMDRGADSILAFDAYKFQQFDHGYAVTSHSSQGLTAQRVLVQVDTERSHSLINNRFAYVAVSRASVDVRIYTNDAQHLKVRLALDMTKTTAISRDLPQKPTDHAVRRFIDLQSHDLGIGI
jgi:ATP-dependent exoDNAse (exonuclease V) alpha subunit